MLALLQLLLAGFAIYGAVEFAEELKLFVPLGCLIVMLAVSRLEKKKSDRKIERKSFLKSEIDKVSRKESTAIKDQDFFLIDSLLWPKSELLLIDAVHSVFKELGFKISAAMSYQSVDRIVKVPDSPTAFGIQVLMSEGELEGNHPKIHRAMQFEREKKEKEKSLLVVSTHIHLPLSDRSKVNHISREVSHFLTRHNMALITTHHLYELLQKAKGGEIDIFKFFERVYSQTGNILPLKGAGNSYSPSFDSPLQ